MLDESNKPTRRDKLELSSSDRERLRLVLHLAEQAIDQQAQRIQQLELALALKTYKRPRGRPRKVLLKREVPRRSPGRPQRFPWLLDEAELKADAEQKL